MIASSSFNNAFRVATKIVAVLGATGLLISGYVTGPASLEMLVYGHVFAALTSALWLGLNRWRLPILIVWLSVNVITAVSLFGPKVETKNACGGNPGVSNDVQF